MKQATTDAERPPDPAPAPAITQFFDPIVRALCDRLGEAVERSRIIAAVEDELVSYRSARVTQFVPVLVERRVYDRLARVPRSAS